MAEIKITQQMIDFYRSKPGNSVLLDSAIVDLIKKDIGLGKLPKEFVQLANDVRNKGYAANDTNVFGYGFNTGTNSELQIERTSSPEELEEINGLESTYSAMNLKIVNCDSEKIQDKISDFTQGCIGDCGLLSTLKALSSNDVGAKYIDNAISIDSKTGDRIVTFIGVNKSYRIPKVKLYSPVGVLGSTNASAIEKAVNMYFKERAAEVENGSGPDIVDRYYHRKSKRMSVYPQLWGAAPEDVIYLLTGASMYHVSIQSEEYDDYKNNPKKYIGTVGFGCKKDVSDLHKFIAPLEYVYRGIVGKPFDNHWFALLGIDSENNIKYSNPWFSKRVLCDNINEIYNDNYIVDINLCDTSDFIERIETVNTQEGSQTFYKTRKGVIRRIDTKDSESQLISIEKYDDLGRPYATQYYENGQKSSLEMRYYNVNNEGIESPFFEEPYLTRCIFNNNKIVSEENIYAEYKGFEHRDIDYYNDSGKVTKRVCYILGEIRVEKE
ncbi:MAG: hypothetical protein MJ231_06490 [bacterium]|nr:hypothetical protein [bacterium]